MEKRINKESKDFFIGNEEEDSKDPNESTKNKSSESYKSGTSMQRTASTINIVKNLSSVINEERQKKELRSSKDVDNKESDNYLLDTGSFVFLFFIFFGKKRKCWRKKR
jgi:hypothetical protein